MSRPTLLRRLTGALASTVVCAAGLLPTAPAFAVDNTIEPLNSNIVITGAGWGHGIGMSQYGAYGAADAGLSYDKILGFYYPGTKTTELAKGNLLRVWITSDTDSRLHFSPAGGLRIADGKGAIWKLPTGTTYKQWRISRSGSTRVLHYKNSAGSWVKVSPGLAADTVWEVDNPTAGYVIVRLPNGTGRDFRGTVSLRFSGSGAKTVNTVAMEDYLRGVVPSEMPASWPTEALKTQAVAARSYAARYQVTPATSSYDICDTSACQVYHGLAIRSTSGKRTLSEHATSNAAIAATADEVLTYNGKVALTMFSSSNGGWAADGGLPYLVAHQDPYDGRKRDQAWSVSLSSSTIQSAYPSIGTFKSLAVARDGLGAWGGRVTAVTLSGSKGSVKVTGGAFKSKFHLKERLFLPVGGLKPATGNYDRWQKIGGTTSWVGAPTSSEISISGGLDAQFEGADLFWSSATGSRYLTGGILDSYRQIGGPESAIGFPKTDVIKTSTGTYTDFQAGRITCPTKGECLVSYG